MVKKTINFRLSNDHVNVLQKYATDHSLANMTEALEHILSSLNSPSQTAQPTQPETSLEWLEKHPCPFRTPLLNTKTGKQILCWEKHRLPIEACITRQKRYIQFNRKCLPDGYAAKKKTPPKAWKERAEKHYVYNGKEFVPESENYFSDNWGDNF